MYNYSTQKKLTVVATACALTASAGAAAQGGSSYRLEEIIVTATKRAQNIQDVPISIQSLSGDTLKERGVEALPDLVAVVPSINFGNQGGSNTIILRGVGTLGGTVGNEPSVATYVDGVYNPNPRVGVSALQDIERIEVLKGPQGTLFGRNSTGGLIHIITKDPTQEPEAKIRMGYSSFDTVEGGFYGSTGLTDTLAANLSVSYKNNDESYIDNPLPGQEYLGDKDSFYRAKLLYTPSENTSAKITAYYGDYEGSSNLPRQMLPGVFSATNRTYTGDWFDLANDFPTYFEYTTKGVSLDVTHQLGAVEITSITAWKEDTGFNSVDGDGSDQLGQHSNASTPAEAFTQELRLASTGDNKVDWIVGLFYSEINAEYDNLKIYQPGAFIESWAKQDTSGWGVFGEANWHLTDKTSLILGLRHSEDEQDISTYTELNGNPRFPQTDASDDFSKLTYRVGLQHDFTDNLMAYATVSRGYKTGLFNAVAVGAPATTALAPEVLDAYEIGFKASGLLDSRMTINGAIFYYDYQDLQVTTIAVAGVLGANAAAATVYGGELELNLQATERLHFTAGVSVLDTEFDTYVGTTNRPAPNGLGNVAVRPVDFSGNSLVRAPDYSFTSAINYVVPTSVGEIAFSLNYFHTDDFYWNEDNRLSEPSYGLLNAEIAWTDPSEKYKISLWGRNITDEKYSTLTTDNPTTGDNYVPGKPAWYGFNAEYRF